MNSRFLRALTGALLLATFCFASPAAFAKEKAAKGPKPHDLTDTIYAANPILTSFTKLLQASPDIYTFLSSKGPFTVFVPTDSAFAKLKPASSTRCCNRRMRTGATPSCFSTSSTESSSR